MFSLRKMMVLGVVVLLAFVLAACNLYQTPTTQIQPSPTSTGKTSVSKGRVITYSDGGFSPAQTKVKVGKKVEFTNSSQGNVQVNSAAHPTHALFPELNIGIIAPGETKTVTFNQAGTYQYHNHLNASQTGTIVVE